MLTQHFENQDLMLISLEGWKTLMDSDANFN
jgi:hypothetical protein